MKHFDEKRERKTRKLTIKHELKQSDARRTVFPLRNRFEFKFALRVSTLKSF